MSDDYVREDSWLGERANCRCDSEPQEAIPAAIAAALPVIMNVLPVVAQALPLVAQALSMAANVAATLPPPQMPAAAGRRPGEGEEEFDEAGGAAGSGAPGGPDSYGIEGPVGEGYYGEQTPAPDYPSASRFVPAKFFDAVSDTRGVRRIVIHITDGGKKIDGTIAHFQNPVDKKGKPLKVSSHYVVGQDGEVVQMVRNNDIAYHAKGANSDSIGIEHVANTKGVVPTAREYCASAALVRWLCEGYGIPMDRAHIIGHTEADLKTTHTGCPNAVWNWDYYMDLVKSATCTQPPAGVPEGYEEIAAPGESSNWYHAGPSREDDSQPDGDGEDVFDWITRDEEGVAYAEWV